MDRKYRNENQFYSTNQRILGNCNAINFVNTGTITVYINNFPVTAGNSLSFSGNENEIDGTEYFIDFRGALNGEVWVMKKINL